MCIPSLSSTGIAGETLHRQGTDLLGGLRLQQRTSETLQGPQPPFSPHALQCALETAVDCKPTCDYLEVTTDRKHTGFPLPK